MTSNRFNSYCSFAFSRTLPPHTMRMSATRTILKRLIAYFLLSVLAMTPEATEHKFKRIQIEDDSRILLGGLFPIHSRGSGEDKPCGDILRDKGIQRLEAMLYAIDLINTNTQSEWPFKIGATILDTCSSDSYALEQSLQLLQYSCGPDGNSSRKVTAVVGASNSDVSAAVANIFRLFQIPQVSYASTSEELDDFYKYPYFFRVVPSDRFMVQVILDILQLFRWSYVSVVASKGEYGEHAAENLRDLIRNSTNDETCIATVEILPRNPSEEDYNAVVTRLDLHDRAKVVIVFLNEDKIKVLLETVENLRLPENRFQWLGSDGWGAKERIMIGHENYVEGTITILPKRFPIPGFDDYFKSLKPSTNTRNPWFKEFWENRFNCVFRSTRSKPRTKLCTDDDDLSVNYQQEGLVPMVIDSVMLLASAFRTLCSKPEMFCEDLEKMESTYRKSLLDIIGNISLKSSQGHGKIISFDKTRSVPVNYTIYQFRQTSKSEKKIAFVDIADWNPFDRLKLREAALWKISAKRYDGQSPVSSCSEVCSRDQEKIPNPDFANRCCWTCRTCDDTHYLPDTHRPCRLCPEGHKPSKSKDSCIILEAEFVGSSLASPWALVPLIFSILGLFGTSVVFVIFFMHHKTPIIMASGRELCYAILVGVLCCYIFPFIVLLEPTEVSCGALRIGMGLGLSICYSAIFTKTNRLSRIFEVSMKITKRPSYISPESQIMICACLVLIQVTLTVLWLIVHPPVVQPKLLESPKTWVVYCGLDLISVLLGLLYNMLLLILCTVYAYKTRNIPENFNETKWIGFTMYSSCIVWLAFVPIYCSAMQDYKVQSTILSMSVSVSGTVTLVCIFLPKIYIVLFHPERNVRYPSSSATSGTGTLDSGQVRYIRTETNNQDTQQTSQIHRSPSPFLLKTNKT